MYKFFLTGNFNSKSMDTDFKEKGVKKLTLLNALFK